MHGIRADTIPSPRTRMETGCCPGAARLALVASRPRLAGLDMASLIPPKRSWVRGSDVLRWYSFVILEDTSRPDLTLVFGIPGAFAGEGDRMRLAPQAHDAGNSGRRDRRRLGCQLRADVSPSRVHSHRGSLRGVISQGVPLRTERLMHGLHATSLVSGRNSGVGTLGAYPTYMSSLFVSTSVSSCISKPFPCMLALAISFIVKGVSWRSSSNVSSRSNSFFEEFPSCL